MLENSRVLKKDFTFSDHGNATTVQKNVQLMAMDYLLYKIGQYFLRNTNFYGGLNHEGLKNFVHPAGSLHNPTIC